MNAVDAIFGLGMRRQVIVQHTGRTRKLSQSLEKPYGISNMPILRMHQAEAKTIGIVFMVTGKSSQRQVGYGQAYIRTALIATDRCKQQTESNATADPTQVIPHPKMPEFVPEHERQLIFGIYVAQKTCCDHDESAGNRQRVRIFIIGNNDTKRVLAIRPV